LGLDPHHGLANQAYGRALRLAGRHGEALHAVRAALEILPDDRIVIGELGWLLATSAADDVRNGSEALTWAEQYLRSAPADPRGLDILAAAHAELGNFTQAAEFARQALANTDEQTNAVLKQEIALRVQLYDSGQPYREGGQGTSR